MKKKLVLFDIDGTLIYHVGTYPGAKSRYESAIKEIYGIDATFDSALHDGSVERKIAWDILQEAGISRNIYQRRFDSYIDAHHRFLKHHAERGVLYKSIENAKSLVQILYEYPGYYLGLITGNAQKIARWKLEHTGMKKYFTFGLFGDEADSRNDMAQLVFDKAKEFFKRSFEPDNIVVIGDTVHDIRCGKAIGAKTIGVTTGAHGPRDVLEKELPTIVVDSLMDKRVFTLLGLKKP